MRLRSWMLIALIIILITAGASAFYFTQSSNNISVTINTNGTDLTVNISPSLIINPEMKAQMEKKASEDLFDSKSTAKSMKNEMESIAKKYNYTANVSIISPYGVDQLPMPAKVNGISMVPTLKDGQEIIVLKTNDYKVNDIVVAMHPNYGLIVKRLKAIELNRVYLMGDNRNVEYSKTGNVIVEKASLDTWLPRENVIGVVKVY